MRYFSNTTKMGKQNTRKNNPWIKFVKATWIDMKKTNKDVKYKDAMKEAGKRYKKKGGAMYFASNAATVKGGSDLADADVLDADAVADASQADADVARADADVTKASVGGRRRRRKSTKKKSRGGKRRRGSKSRRGRR